MPIPYPSDYSQLHATGSSYSPSKYIPPYEPTRDILVELWECSYCKQTNSMKSLECTHCGAGQIRSRGRWILVGGVG